MEREKRKILEVRTESGELLFNLRLIVKSEPDPKPHQDGKKPPGPGSEQEEKKGNGQSSGANALMTDAQKQYLYRLLAGQGIEEHAALEELKKVFGVDSLTKVTKLAASQEIEKRRAAPKVVP